MLADRQYLFIDLIIVDIVALTATRLFSNCITKQTVHNRISGGHVPADRLLSVKTRVVHGISR